MSLEQRKQRLKQLKMKTSCSACERKGHWAGGEECSKEGTKKTGFICAQQNKTQNEIRSTEFQTSTTHPDQSTYDVECSFTCDRFSDDETQGNMLNAHMQSEVQEENTPEYW